MNGYTRNGDIGMTDNASASGRSEDSGGLFGGDSSPHTDREIIEAYIRYKYDQYKERSKNGRISR